MEQRVDVFHCIKLIRAKRPQFIENEVAIIIFILSSLWCWVLVLYSTRMDVIYVGRVNLSAGTPGKLKNMLEHGENLL